MFPFDDVIMKSEYLSLTVFIQPLARGVHDKWVNTLLLVWLSSRLFVAYVPINASLPLHMYRMSPDAEIGVIYA